MTLVFSHENVMTLVFSHENVMTLVFSHENAKIDWIWVYFGGAAQHNIHLYLPSLGINHCYRSPSGVP